LLINLHIENDLIQKITQVKYINSLRSFEHCELELIVCLLYVYNKTTTVKNTFGEILKFLLVQVRVVSTYHDQRSNTTK
jgi:hypothetical protein